MYDSKVSSDFQNKIFSDRDKVIELDFNLLPVNK